MQLGGQIASHGLKVMLLHHFILFRTAVCSLDDRGNNDFHVRVGVSFIHPCPQWLAVTHLARIERLF